MKFFRLTPFLLPELVVTLFIAGCANRGQGPTGGPKDIYPPVVVKTYPVNKSLYFNKKEIQIDFDEIVNVDKPNDNVIVSPPQVKYPDVKSYGKRIKVQLNDELLDSTTYSINFGNSIQDVNEKNPLRNFVFSFSTGPSIDTLKIAGTVLNAENLNPMKGVLVGVYLLPNDSDFFTKPFLSVARTDDKGHFSIENIKAGKYKIYALGDVDRNYFYQPGEGVALFDSLIEPSTRMVQMVDTIWRDSITYDSVRTFMGTGFFPNDLVLNFFKEIKKRQYLVKNERKHSRYFTLFFNDEMKSMPVLTPINFSWSEDKYLIQKNSSMDTLTYWLTDSLIYNTDTLQLAVRYFKSDSLLNLVETVDTINVIDRSFAKSQRNKTSGKKKSERKVEPLPLNDNIQSTFEVYNSIEVKLAEPMLTFDSTKIHLYQLIDTTFKELPFVHHFHEDRMNLTLSPKWIPDETYQLLIDSACLTSIYGKISQKQENKFKLRSLDEYSSLKLSTPSYDPRVVFQLLNQSDEVISSKSALAGGTKFEYLKPGDYFVRLFIDENQNGKWDSGVLEKNVHPERVYYYPQKISLKANWDFDQVFDYLSVPLVNQKPLKLQTAGNKNTRSN